MKIGRGEAGSEGYGRLEETQKRGVTKGRNPEKVNRMGGE